MQRTGNWGSALGAAGLLLVWALGCSAEGPEGAPAEAPQEASTPSVAQQPSDAQVSSPEDADALLYALGQALAQPVRPLGPTGPELDAFLQGVSDTLGGRPEKLDFREYESRFAEFGQRRAAARAEAERAAAAPFLAEAAAQDGAERFESGVIFRQVTAGTGASPEANSRVKVHYTGTLRDGTVFDSSRERNEPATFSLAGVIPCWTEALQRMRPGGRAMITCPAESAYGDTGKGLIPPGAALRFDVELLEVDPT